MNRIMKSVFIFFLLFLGSLVFANQDINIEKAVLKNGINVYIKNIPNNKINVVYFVVKGGTDYLTPETSGLEDALFTIMTKGSEKYSYSDIQALEFDTQSSITSSSSRNGCVFGLTSIDYYFDESFEYFVDCFLHPSFDAKQYELMITQYNQAIQSMLNNPSSMLFYYSQKIIYENHPYQISSSVTIDSINNITIEKMKQLHYNIMDSRRISVVACGDFDSNLLIEKLNDSVGNIKKSSYELSSDKIEQINIQGENAVFLHQSSSGTGFVMRAFASPSVKSPDYPVAKIICDIYSDILFNVVRENYGACYTPQTSILSSESPFGFEYLYRLSNLTDFTKYVQEARNIMKQGKVISGRNKNGEYMFEDLDSRLEGYKNSYINKKYATQETTSGIASRMSASILQFDDLYAIDKITEIVKKTTKDDVLHVFNKYWIEEPSRWFAVVSPEDEEKIKF